MPGHGRGMHVFRVQSSDTEPRLIYVQLDVSESMFMSVSTFVATSWSWAMSSKNRNVSKSEEGAKLSLTDRRAQLKSISYAHRITN